MHNKIPMLSPTEPKLILCESAIQCIYIYKWKLSDLASARVTEWKWHSRSACYIINCPVHHSTHPPTRRATSTMHTEHVEFLDMKKNQDCQTVTAYGKDWFRGYWAELVLNVAYIIHVNIVVVTILDGCHTHRTLWHRQTVNYWGQLSVTCLLKLMFVYLKT